MKELSVIIPHYNCPSKLKRLLESIPGEDWIEILVVDDGSSEYIQEYLELVEEYRARGVLFFENSIKHKGAGGARNQALLYATGVWVIFADSDDYFLPNFASAVHRAMNTKSDIVFFAPTSIKEGQNILSDRHIYYADLVSNWMDSNSDEDRFKNECFLRYTYWTPWSKIIRRELIEKNEIRFEESLHTNDMLFSVKCGIFAKSIECIGIPVYCISESTTSLTSDHSKNTNRMRRKMIRKVYFYTISHIDKSRQRALGYTWRTTLYHLICGIIDTFA